MPEILSGSEYEALVEQLMNRLATVATVATQRLERPKERLPGASGTTHQIDVLWDFTAEDGALWRLLFEARSYKNRLKQAAVFAFNGVLEDIAQTVPERRCVGVMVTATGYQAGAQIVGESNGVLLLELRSPTDGDMSGRVTQIRLIVVVRLPTWRNIRVELLENAQPQLSGVMEVEYSDGSRQDLVKVITEGESAPMGQPPAPVPLDTASVHGHRDAPM